MRDQLWQDETVQMLKQGYREEIDRLKASLAAKDALIEELSHIGAHAWELADHHTRSYAKAPLLSDQQVKKFYEGMREEAIFFKRLLEKFSKYIKAAQ